jgi:hypothetical protein
LAKDCRVSSKEITAAAAMGDASTGGLIDDLLMPTYYSGVLQRSSPKNYVMHPRPPVRLAKAESDPYNRLGAAMRGIGSTLASSLW